MLGFKGSTYFHVASSKIFTFDYAEERNKQHRQQTGDSKRDNFRNQINRHQQQQEATLRLLNMFGKDRCVDK
jgi:hypothetical protein